MPWSSLHIGCRTGPSPWPWCPCGSKSKWDPMEQATALLTCWDGQCLLGTHPSVAAAGLCVFPLSWLALEHCGFPRAREAPRLPLLMDSGQDKLGRGVLAPAPLGPLMEDCSLTSLQLCSRTLIPT